MQEKIERLNRQQQLLQQQRDQRMKFLEDQRLREKAQVMVNEALLTRELAKNRSNQVSRENLAKNRSNQASRENLSRMGGRTVSNGSLAYGDREMGRRSVSIGSLANEEKEVEKEDKLSNKADPETTRPASGRLSRLSNPNSEKTNKSEDFFENVHIEGQGILNDSDNPEEKDKLVSAIQSEFRRLSTS